jgi:hypothetical protein
LPERLQSSKSTWAGIARRREFLAGVGIVLPDDLGPAGDKPAIDDVPDAAAAAWTALRVVREQARPHPDGLRRRRAGQCHLDVKPIAQRCLEYANSVN